MAETISGLDMFLIDSLRISALYVTLGFALGLLIHIVITPDSLGEIFD